MNKSVWLDASLKEARSREFPPASNWESYQRLEPSSFQSASLPSIAISAENTGAAKKSAPEKTWKKFLISNLLRLQFKRRFRKKSRQQKAMNSEPIWPPIY